MNTHAKSLSLILLAAFAGSVGCTDDKSDPKEDLQPVTTAGNPEEETPTPKGQNTVFVPSKGHYLGLGVRKKSTGLALQEKEAGTESDSSLPGSLEVVLQNFKIDNSIVGTELPVDDTVFQVSQSPDGRIFGISDHDAFEIDAKTGALSPLGIEACDSRVSWLHGITWDTKRNRLLVASAWADGLLCGYDPAAKKWSLIGEFTSWAGTTGIIYDAAADNIIMPVGSNLGPNVVACSQLSRISAEDASAVRESELQFSETLYVIRTIFKGGIQYNIDGTNLVVRSLFDSGAGEGGFKLVQDAALPPLHSEIRTVELTRGTVTTHVSTFNDMVAKILKPRSPDGNIFIFGNYEGGTLRIEADIAVEDLKIGVTSYEAIKVEVTGQYASSVKKVLVAGYEEGSSVSGVGSGVASVSNVSTGEQMAQAPFYDPLGNGSVACVTGADDGGGCSTKRQVEAFFQQALGGVVRSMSSQYEPFTGTIKLSDLK